MYLNQRIIFVNKHKYFSETSWNSLYVKIRFSGIIMVYSVTFAFKNQNMVISQTLSNHVKGIFFGGNWTTVNFKDVLTNVSIDIIYEKPWPFYENTILALTCHVHYYTKIQKQVFQGGPLTGNDAESFLYPYWEKESDWQHFLDHMWGEVETFTRVIEEKPEIFWDEKFGNGNYGTNYQNVVGLIEHAHYHLGQIVLLKKACQQLPL